MSYTESILTEDYANKFNECLIPGINPTCKSDIDQDSVFTEEMETKIRNPMDEYKYAGTQTGIPQISLEFDEKDAFNIERKYQEILKKRRNKSNSYLSPSYQPGVVQYKENYRHQDDQSTVYDDYSMEIRQKKNAIQKDLELERQRFQGRSRSPTFQRGYKADNMTPRETLEHKVLELDQLTASVRKATMEHQQLCKELDDMKNQLRKNQAEVRLSERLAWNNEEKFDLVNKEAKEAERRRDQTLRQLDVVNEELSLKRAKLRTLDNQMAREMADIRRMEHCGINKDEIENILAERDELYKIVKRQEDVQLEKYELAKQLNMMKDDMASEQEKNGRQIQALEDELDASMRKIKQLQFEREDVEAELNHLKQHLEKAEEQAIKSSREVSELRGEYQMQIRKKLEEYEMDKERVENELRKMEERTSMDQTTLKNNIEHIRQELKKSEKDKDALKNAVAELEDQLRKADQTNRCLIDDHQVKLRQIQRESEERIQKQKNEILHEQRLITDEREIQFGHDKNKIQKQCDEEIERLIFDIQMKDDEIVQLQQQLKDQESTFNAKLEQEKKDFDALLKREKLILENTVTKKKTKEVKHIQETLESETKSLRADLERLNLVLKERENEICSLKHELVEAQLENKKMLNDNLLKLRKTKENVKEDTIKELKNRYENRMEKELIKVKTDLQRKSNSKLKQVIDEKLVVEEVDKRNSQLLCKIVKTVIHEINEECRKMAVLLNVHPRRVNHSNLSEDFTKSDNIITQALANLEACGSEIRALVEELEMKIKTLSDHIADSDSKMEVEIHHIRNELEVEKQRDIGEIREKLLKDYLLEIERLAKAPDVGLQNLLREKEREIARMHSERESWKERAAEKIASKFDKLHQKKLNELRNMLLQREKELRQLRSTTRRRSLTPTSKTTKSSSALDLDTNSLNLMSSPAKIIFSLQENLKVLREENQGLRKKLSTPDYQEKKARWSDETEKYQKEIGGSEFTKRKTRWNDNHPGSVRLSRSCSRSRER